MTMSEIERLANAGRGAWLLAKDTAPDSAELWKATARGFLLSLREPSEETYQAGWRAFEDLPIVPQRIWQAMIDHLLSDLPAKTPREGVT